MTPDFPTLPDHARREILTTALRILVTSAVIIVVLAPAPRFDADAQTPAWLLIVSGLLWFAFFLLVFWWQLKRVWASNKPQKRMIEAIAVIFVLFISIFGRIYSVLSQSNPASFSEDLNYFDGLYLAMTVLSTVGFGDIVPETTVARSLAMAQMASNLILIGFAFRVVTGVAARAREHKKAPSGS